MFHLCQLWWCGDSRPRHVCMVILPLVQAMTTCESDETRGMAMTCGTRRASRLSGLRAYQGMESIAVASHEKMRTQVRRPTIAHAKKNSHIRRARRVLISWCSRNVVFRTKSDQRSCCRSRVPRITALIFPLDTRRPATRSQPAPTILLPLPQFIVTTGPDSHRAPPLSFPPPSRSTSEVEDCRGISFSNTATGSS